MRVKIHDEITFPNILNLEPYLLDPSLREKKRTSKKRSK